MQRVLVVDDEEGVRTFVAEAIEGPDVVATMAADGAEAADLLARRSFHLLITDLKMPGLGGMDLLRKMRAEQPEMEVIVLTAHGTVESAVEAMKLGACDYLCKPLSGLEELRLVVSRALERRSLRDERQRRGYHRESASLVARDPVMLAVVEQVDKVAATDATVLLLGESGTGKEVVAWTLHERSLRRDGPFVPVNCAALSEHLLESEMFGHEKGAFTGAVSRRRGRFELADSGTLFLDEVAEIRPELQVKLLRVLEERRFERVGGTRLIEVDIRLIAATNRSLDERMREGAFRADLYHRLAVFPVELPPLRDRPGDLLPLSEHLLERIGRRLGRPGLVLEPEAVRTLERYAWPGNVRELANVLERAAILATGAAIGPEQLSLASHAPPGPGPCDGTLEELEREAIRRALEREGGHRKRAAERLGIGLRTLYAKLKEFGL